VPGGASREEVVARILVVEDQPAVAQLLGEMLETGGHDVAFARTGYGAAPDVVERTYDLLITDIVMPDVSGWQLIKLVRDKKPSIPVIAISGGSATLRTETALRMSGDFGADATLAKPIDMDLLLETVEQVLKRGRS